MYRIMTSLYFLISHIFCLNIVPLDFIFVLIYDVLEGSGHPTLAFSTAIILTSCCSFVVLRDSVNEFLQ